MPRGLCPATPEPVGFSVDSDIHLVHDGAKVSMEAGNQDLAKVLEVKALVVRAFADADPGDVTLADVLDAGGAVDEIVHLAFQDRLKVGLHLAPGNPDDDPHVHRALVRNLVKARANDLDLAVFDLIHLCHIEVLKGAAVLAAKLDSHIVLAHHLALKSRAIGDRHGHLGDLDLDSTDLDGLLDHLFRPLQIIFGLDLIKGHRDDVLVASDASGMDLGDDRIGDNRETVADGAGRGRVLEIIDFTQRQDKGKDAELVV